jgi:capsular polysaccharide transport system permease protein
VAVVTIEVHRRETAAARDIDGSFVGRGQKLLAKIDAFVRRFTGFTIVVILPVLAATLYYAFIAADIYASSAQFIVKSANESATLTGLGSFLQSTGIATTTNDAYSVDAYLQSRDALANLEKDPGIRAIYDRSEADFVTRFPNLIYHGSFENLFLHYSDWIEVDFDTSSNITTLTVYAFRAADSHAVATRLLKLGEAEVNHLNDRVRADALRGARKEVGNLQRAAIRIQNKLTGFRNRELLLDPNQTSTSSVALLASLESQLVSTRSDLRQLQASAPGSPQIPSLRSRIAAIEGQIDAEERKGAGGSNSLAPKMAQYGELLLEQQFTQQMLQSAVTSLEAAEATVQQQQLYLAPVTQPNLPDLALYPYRLLDILIVLCTSLLIYGIGKLLLGTIYEHLAS